VKRKIIPELLDTDSGSTEEVESSLKDLRHINSWFGGNGTAVSMFTKVAKRVGSKSISALEIAAGVGDVPVAVQCNLRSRGINMSFTLLDRVSTHFGRLHSNGNRNAVVADALCLPFADSSYDVIHCCLFAHHLSPAELVSFVNESLRVSRTAVLINDLIRNPVHLAFVYAGLPLFRSRITWHDAPASVRQAYTVGEMREILKQSVASKVEVNRHYLFRMGATIWK
jgi:ubiquinone/menaquinone biosynthesis C-methylase UbiE